MSLGVKGLKVRPSRRRVDPEFKGKQRRERKHTTTTKRIYSLAVKLIYVLKFPSLSFFPSPPPHVT